MNPSITSNDDGENEIALGDQDLNNLFLGTSPDGVDTFTPGADEVAFDGSMPALGDLSLFSPSDDSFTDLFNPIPQIDQTVGSDFAFFPAANADFSAFLPSSSEDSQHVFAFQPGLGDNSNPEGFFFALAPETDITGDGSLFVSR